MAANTFIIDNGGYTAKVGFCYNDEPRCAVVWIEFNKNQ